LETPHQNEPIRLLSILKVAGAFDGGIIIFGVVMQAKRKREKKNRPTRGCSPPLPRKERGACANQVPFKNRRAPCFPRFANIPAPKIHGSRDTPRGQARDGAPRPSLRIHVAIKNQMATCFPRSRRHHTGNAPALIARGAGPRCVIAQVPKQTRTCALREGTARASFGQGSAVKRLICLFIFLLKW